MTDLEDLERRLRSRAAWHLADGPAGPHAELIEAAVEIAQLRKARVPIDLEASIHKTRAEKIVADLSLLIAGKERNERLQITAGDIQSYLVHFGGYTGQDAPALSSEARVPEGWVLVPVAPTDVMIDAAEAAVGEWRKTLTRDEAMARSYRPSHQRKFIASATPAEKHAIRYRAMLAASPQPPDSKGGGNERAARRRLRPRRPAHDRLLELRRRLATRVL